MTTLSGFQYDGKIYVTTVHTNDRVEGHVRLTCGKAGSHIRYRGRVILRTETGYRYECKPGSLSRPCKKAMTALLNIEKVTSPRDRMDKSMLVDLGAAVPTKPVFEIPGSVTA